MHPRTGTPRSRTEPLISVWILAGGKSSRMGQDKALLQWHGVPLLTRMCQAAQAVSSTVQVLSPWPERYRATLPAGIESITESREGRGPLWALVQGLEQSRTPWTLLLACDMPLLQGAYLRHWGSHLKQLPSTCLAYVPQTQHSGRCHWEPLCGFYRQESLGALTSFLNQGGRSFQDWLPQVNAHPICLSADQVPMLFNCNTPEDWSEIEKLTTPSPFTEETS